MNSAKSDSPQSFEELAGLKTCVAGVVGSMGASQDWEAAAAYITRAGRIPDEINRLRHRPMFARSSSTRPEPRGTRLCGNSAYMGDKA